MSNPKKELFVALFFSFIAIFCLREIFFTPGLVSGNDWGLPPETTHIIRGFKAYAYTWYHQASLGGSAATPVHTTMLNLFSIPYLLASIGFSGDVISKLLLFFFFIISGTTSYILLRFLKIGRFASLVSATLYTLNPLTFNYMGLGAFGHFLNYAILPLTLYFFMNAVRADKSWLKYSILTAFTFIIFFPVHIFAVGIALFIAYSTFEIVSASNKRSSVKIHLKPLLTIIGLFIILQAYWTMPFLASPQTATGGLQFQVMKLKYMNIIESIRLWGFFAPYFESEILNSNLTTKTIGLLSSFIVPVIAFSSLLFLKREKKVIFFSAFAITLIGLLSLPLTYALIKKNFLFLGIFRDVSPIFWLVALSYLFLIGYTVNILCQRVSKETYKLIGVSIITLLSLAVYCSPFFLTGNFSGYIETVIFPDENREVDNWLSIQNDVFKVLWLPTGGMISKNDVSKWCSDHYSAFSAKPGGFTEFNFRSRFIPEIWLNNLLYEGNTSRTISLGKILGLYNIEYLILRNNVEIAQWATVGGEVWARRTSTVFSTIEQQSDLELYRVIGGINIYKNKGNNPLVYATDSPIIITGDLSSLLALSDMPDFYFYNHTLIFASQTSSLEPVELVDNTIISNNNFMDLAIPFASPEFVIDPGYYVTTQEVEGQWTNLHEIYWWYDTDYQAGLENCAFTKGNNAKLNIPINVGRADNYTIYVKAYQGPKNGILYLNLGETMEKIGMNNQTDKGYVWKEAGKTQLSKGQHNLEIISDGENVIARILVVPESDLKGIMKRCLSLYKDSDYNLKVKVSQNFAKIKNSGLYLKMGEPSEKEKWLFNSLNIDYRLFPSEDLLLFTYFNGDSQEDEFVEIKREKIRVDLERYPYIKLVYGVEDPNAQTIDIIAGIDFTGNGRVDEDVSLREEIILKNWKKTTPENKTMDFYETRLPSRWPKEYITKFPSRERFIVYKDKVPLGTTWGEWADYKELVEIGVKTFNRLVIAIPKGESPEGSLYKVSYLPGIRGSDEFKGFNQLEINLREIIKRKFPYKEHYFLVNLTLQLRKIPGLDCSEGERTYKYYLKNIELYSNLAVIIPIWKSDFKEKIRHESRNVVDYNYFVSDKEGVLISSYFDGKTEEEEYVKMDIPVAGYNIDKYPFLDIVYKLDDALVQAFDCKIGVDFTEDGVVDEEIFFRGSITKTVVLEKWEETVPGNQTMDFYETRLPLEWPKEYTTKYPSLGKFTVYKNGVPMRTAWRRWDDYKEFVEIGFGEYNRLVIAVPKGTSPEENIYTVSYLSFAGKVKRDAGFNELRLNLGERLKEILPEKESIKIMNISLYLRKGEGVDCSSGKRGIYTFNIKEIKAYKISNLSMKEMLREDEESLKDIPLFKMEDKVYSLKDMDKVEIESEGLLGEVKDLHLSRGDYEFSSLENETFKVDWFIMEPSDLLSEDSEVKIEFRKINPTRYTVYAEAEKSFWLVFSESFHKDWKAYIRKVEIEDDKDRSFAKKQRFEWSALITLWRDLGKRKELKEHYLVNGYANGWWVPVEADSQVKRFEVILEFTPQRLFEIGIVISGVTFILCITYLVHSYFKKRRRRRV